MSIFQKLTEAAQFNIVCGSNYRGSCFGYHARFLDFHSDQFNVDFSLIFDSTNQQVFQASLYFKNLAFRWTHPEYIKGYKNECYLAHIDPRIAYDAIHFVDCDVFEDFLNKVYTAFHFGQIDQTIAISLVLSQEQQFLFNQLPDTVDLQKLIQDSLIEKTDELFKKNTENWDIIFSTLSQSGIELTLDDENAPINENHFQAIYDWVKSLNSDKVSLHYFDKETSDGLVSYLIANHSHEPHFTFKYIYEK